MRQRGEVQAVARPQWAYPRQFSPIENGKTMNNEAEKNDNRTEPVATSASKQPWHAPEIEEVDFAETESTANGTGLDTFAYS